MILLPTAAKVAKTGDDGRFFGKKAVKLYSRRIRHIAAYSASLGVASWTGK